MSDKTNDTSREDAAIEQAWEQATVTSSGPRPLPDIDVDPSEVREYTELLGLMAWELEPEAPGPHVKEQLMARLQGTTEADDARAPSGTVVTIGGSKATPAPPAAPERPVGATAAANGGWVQWAMAASLAACLVGLGYFGAQSSTRGEALAHLSDQLSAVSAELAVARAENEDRSILRSRLNMITNVAQQAYRMRSVSNGPSATRAPEGVVFVCGRHQQWFLSLKGLEPPPSGKEYNLWFMTKDGAVNGGTMDVQADSATEIEDVSMPEGTRGFGISLETAGGTFELPSDLLILGDEAVSL